MISGLIPLRLCALGLAAACLAAAAQAQTTLINTFGPSDTFTTVGTTGASSSGILAERFPGPSGAPVTVTSVTIAGAISGSVSDVEIAIYGESLGLPVDPPIIVAPVPGPIFGTPSVLVVPVSSSVELQPGQNYWIAVRAAGAGSFLWVSGLVGTATPAANFGSGWTVTTAPSPRAVRIVGAVTVVPCCNSSGTGCAVVEAAACAALGGIPGTGTCAAINCTLIAPGACCFGAGCLVLTKPACFSAGGRFLNSGTTCATLGRPNPCCFADYNGNGAATVSDIFDFLNEWFAGCP